MSSSKEDLHYEHLVDDMSKKGVKAKLYCKHPIDKNETFEEFSTIKSNSSSKYKQWEEEMFGKLRKKKRRRSSPSHRVEVVGCSRVYKEGSNQKKVKQGPQVIEVRRKDTTVQPQKKQKEVNFNQLRVDDSLRSMDILVGDGMVPIITVLDLRLD